MKVLLITGDRRFGPGNERYELQRNAVEELAVVFWGRGSLWPKIPPGQFDVVSAQDPFWRGLFGWRVAKKLGAKFNVQVHTDLSAQSLVRHVLGQIVLRHADSVRVVSEKIKQQVARIGVRAKISVLPVFVDLEKFRTISRALQLPKTILWIGRFEPEKDPLYAFEVLRQVPGARLVMLGAGSLAGELKQKAEGLSVSFPGWQDLKPYLAQADMVLCTSRHESWGQSIVEALAAGVPVVAPDVGIAREAGALIAPRADLAEKVKEVLQSGARGELKLNVLAAPQWVAAWKQSLT